MMHKIIAPGSYAFDQPRAQLVKVSGRGLRGDDLGDLIKRSGYAMADAIRHIKLGSGEVPIHLIALGDTTAFGYNRNGDGFDEDTCRTRHHTFVKHARSFRDHDNKRVERSYGTVKFSCYNEPMHRIELLVALNGTKEAALRNGGLVADKELEQLAKDANAYSVSMATKVPHDVCNSCGNKARTRAEYCTADTCPHGGLKHNITKVSEDGHMLGALNPNCTFFDISKVWRPADRIAYVLGRIEKAAASGDPQRGSAELAEEMGLTCPFDLWLAEQTDRGVRTRMKVAADLAALEGDTLTKYAGAWLPHAQDPIPLPRSGPAGLNPAYRALADERALLPARDFLRIAHGVPDHKAAAAARELPPYLRDVYTAMVDDPASLAADLVSRRYAPCDCVPDPDTRAWARKAAEACSLDPAHVRRRAWLSAIRTKDASAPRTSGLTRSELVKYAKEYALYQLEMLGARASDIDFALTAEMVIRNNHGS